MLTFTEVLGIRMFLALQDPDRIVGGTDPDPSLSEIMLAKQDFVTQICSQKIKFLKLKIMCLRVSSCIPYEKNMK